MGKESDEKKAAGCGCLVIFFICVVFCLLNHFACSSSNPQPAPAQPAPPPTPYNEAMQKVRLLAVEWEYDDGILGGWFTVANNSKYDLKDFVINVQEFGASGTEIDHLTTTIYSVVYAGTTNKIHNLKIGIEDGQTVHKKAEIVDFELVDK